MAKPETKSDVAKPVSTHPQTLPVRPGTEAPHETRDKRLPRQLSDSEFREVVASVRAKLPAEADALESDREYASARPVVAKEDKVAVDAEAQRWRRKFDDIRARARELPQRVAYWMDLYERERHFADPGQRQIPSPEHIGQKALDWLNLEEEPEKR